MNRRLHDTLPSRRIARAARAALDWLRREDNDLLAVGFWCAVVVYGCAALGSVP